MLEKSHYNNKYPNTRKKGIVDYETIIELLEYNQAIPAQERDKAYVKETNSFYDWRVGDNSVADGVNIIAQKSGKGRWVKIGNTENNPIPPNQNTPQSTLFFDTKEDFPETGETDKVYISKDNGINWTWNATHEKYIDSEGRTGVYKALLSQVGTNAPTAVVQLNTLGEVVWIRNSAGSYAATSVNLFTLNKTICKIESITTYTFWTAKATINKDINENTINFFTSDIASISNTDSRLRNTYVEIEVYN
jgi:hypothetical protein